MSYRYNFLVDAPYVLQCLPGSRETTDPVSATDYNPLRRTAGWDNVKIAPPGIMTDISLQREDKLEEAEFMREQFSHCVTCRLSAGGEASGAPLATLRCGGCKILRYCSKVSRPKQ